MTEVPEKGVIPVWEKNTFFCSC